MTAEKLGTPEEIEADQHERRQMPARLTAYIREHCRHEWSGLHPAIVCGACAVAWARSEVDRARTSEAERILARAALP